jgi:hypothetical protein
LDCSAVSFQFHPSGIASLRQLIFPEARDVRLRGIMSNLKDWTVNAKPERFSVLRSYFDGGRDFLVYLMP